MGVAVSRNLQDAWSCLCYTHLHVQRPWGGTERGQEESPAGLGLGGGDPRQTVGGSFSLWTPIPRMCQCQRVRVSPG